MFPLRKFSIIAAICTLIGFFLVFSPAIINPAIWYSSNASLPASYAFVGYFILPGLILAMAGMIMLMVAFVIFSRRSRRLQIHRSLNYDAYKDSFKPAILASISFGVVRALQPMIWKEPAAIVLMTNTSQIQNLEFSIFGAFVIGFMVSFYLVRYYDRLPGDGPISKSVIVSFLVLFILGGLGTLFQLNDAMDYFLVSVLYGAPSYFALGIVLGFSYKRFNLEPYVQESDLRTST